MHALLGIDPMLPGLPFDAAAAASVEEHAMLMGAALESVEARAQGMAQLVSGLEEQCASYHHQLEDATSEVLHHRSEAVAAAEREQQLHQEVSRLGALLEAARLTTRFREEQLHTALGEERARVQALRVARDGALESRDEAVADLALAYADIEAMQATLADSALYVRQLRLRVAEMEVSMRSQQAREREQAARQRARERGQGGGAAGPEQQQRDQQERGVFSLSSIQAAISTAVKEAGGCEQEERRRRIRQLQLRWHPDKNPVLREFATEVTKMINEAVAQLEGTCS